MIGQICKVKNCTRILKKTDGRICQVHRSRWFLHKDYDYISPNWPNLKDGSYNNYGYWRVTRNGKRILEHRWVMEQHLGRPLLRTEVIHHRNGIRNDNKLENLELISTRREHIHKYHPQNWRKRKVNNPHL